MPFISIYEKKSSDKNKISIQSHYRIIYLLSNGYFYVTNKERNELVERSFLMVAPDQKLLIPDNTHYIELEFDYEYISLVNKTIIDNCFINFHIKPHEDNKKLLSSLINNIIEEYNKFIRQDNILLKLLVSELIVRLSRIAILDYKKENINNKMRESTIKDVITYINKNFTTCTLDSVCEKFYITKPYLCRSFKKNTGVSFTDYINNKKIEIGANLLINTDKSIEEIAQICGYASGNYFGTCFRNIMKISPLKYRKQYSY